MANQFGIHSGYFHPTLRKWQQADTGITPSNLMYPIFISHDNNAEEEIASMPGVKRWGLNRISGHLEPLVKAGLQSILIFGVADDATKDNTGSVADNPAKSIVIPAIKLIRQNFPDLLIACDICLCTWTTHGHCGILTEEGLDVERSAERLAEIAVSFAKAGCHVVAPSDMMDGRILAIKKGLKGANLHKKVSVLSYSAKFSSCLYGPFRDAAKSAPSFGDRKAYQLPVGSAGLAERAADRDVEEGADMLMVKPGIFYLDVIRNVKQKHPNYPLFAYQVSGEYSSIILGANNGLFNLEAAIVEAMTCFRRAGTDVVISYFTPKLLEMIKAGQI
jgi:porphobilinogen synthase